MNALTRACALVPVAAALMTLQPGPAEACGGCFVPPEENTQVTGHRMILSVGMTQSTLYDQIEYSGDPAEFAWVLPIQGTVDIGISSDLVFNQLGFDTAVQVLEPPRNCPVYSCGNEDDFGSSASSGTGGASEGGGVEVIAQEVVGPYETVQLASSDPGALNAWLDSHGYSVPSDIQPIIASYVSDGFNFLAMKLVPGVGIDKMQPVRITTQGASPVLPLKMVAAGTGATTTMTLYVISEGRYEPTNFPAFTIPPEAVLWDYESSDSNYTALRKLAYDATGGRGWLVEASMPYSASNFRSQVAQVVDFQGPGASGYTDDPNDYEGAHAALNEDMDVLFAGMKETSVSVTRFRAELSRPALAQDLFMGASDDQSPVSNVIQTTKWTGTQPACPPPPDCDDVDVYYPNGTPASDGDPRTVSSCAMSHERDVYGAATFGGLAILVMLGFRVRRRR